MCRISLTPDCSVSSQMSRGQHLESYGEEKLKGQKREAEQTFLPHTRAFAYVTKTCLRSLEGKAISVWNNVQIKARHCHRPMTSSSAAPTLNWWLVHRSEVKSFKKNHFQTDRILYCMTTQTVLCKGRALEWHSIILSVWGNCWETQMLFMVQSTEGIQSSLSFKCIIIEMQSCSNERVFKRLSVHCAVHKEAMQTMFILSSVSI